MTKQCKNSVFETDSLTITKNGDQRKRYKCSICGSVLTFAQMLESSHPKKEREIENEDAYLLNMGQD